MRGASFLVEPRIERVRSTASKLIVDFEDGRSVHLPLAWYPRLFDATQAQRGGWELTGPGIGVHWPELDEDLRAAGILADRPSIEYIRQTQRATKRSATA